MYSQINLQRLSATEGFELSEAQYQTLHSIADAYSTHSPAACALLSLLRGEHCEWQIPPDVGSGKNNTKPRYKAVPLLNKNVLNRLSIAPNPASNSFEVQLPVYFWQHTGSIQILNFSGRTLQNLPLAAEQRSLIVQTADMPNGIYLVQYTADGVLVTTAKVAVQR